MKEVKGFDIGSAASNDHEHEIALGFDADGKVNAAIKIVGKNSQRFRDAERAITKLSLKRSSVRGRSLDLKLDTDAEEFLETREHDNIEMAVAVTVGWHGLTSNGAEYAFSEANARALFKSNTYVRERVLAAVENAGNFLKR